MMFQVDNGSVYYVTPGFGLKRVKVQLPNISCKQCILQATLDLGIWRLCRLFNEKFNVLVFCRLHQSASMIQCEAIRLEQFLRICRHAQLEQEGDILQVLL